MDWEIRLLYSHKKHSTNSDTRACCFEALRHGSLWLKIKEEFNISALVDSGPACYPQQTRLDSPLTQANFSDIFQHGGPRFKKIPHLPQPTMGSPLKNTRALINNIVSLMTPTR